MVAIDWLQFLPVEDAVQFRNTIRLAVAVAATGALAIGVSMFHTGGDIQTAGNLVRAALVVMALLIGSLSLDIGRAVDTLATAATVQEARFQGYEDKIERDAEYVRKLWIVWQVAACLLILPTTALVWYFHNSVTALVFGTPDTRFMMSTLRQHVVGIILYCLTLFVAIEPVRFGLLLLLAKDCHLGAARVASQQETAIVSEDGRYYTPMSRIAYFRLFCALLTACLLANAILAVSYVRVADRGIGVVDLLGTTEVFHPWADVCSITETHFIGGADPTYPAHDYTIQFRDGSEWKSGSIHEDPVHIVQWDPRAEIEFAADRANLPIKSVDED